jgi:autotransporter-associated beta strand protein
MYISSKSILSTVIRRLALFTALVFTPWLAQAVVAPYTADGNTTFLFHFDEAAGGSVTANAGSVGGNAYSVAIGTGTSISSTPVSTLLLGGSAYSSAFNNAISFPNTNSGFMIGFAGASSGFMSDYGNGNARSTNVIAESVLGIGASANSPWTIEAMIKPTKTNYNQEIVCMDSYASSRGFQFKINTAGQLQFQTIGGTAYSLTNNIPNSGANGFVANNWYHVAVVYNGSTMQLYWTAVNATTPSAATLGSAATPTSGSMGTSQGAITGPLVIGNKDRLAALECFNGSIDEVRISNIARTPTTMIFSTGVTITSQPQNELVPPGGNTTFTVSAVATTDYPTLSYQWYVGTPGSGTAVTSPDANGATYTGMTGPTLTINGAPSGDNGLTFYCVVSNNNSPANTATSTAALLTVHTPLNLSWLASPADYNWNGTSIDWLNTANSSDVSFTIGDNVTFDDGGSTASPVSVVGALAPSSVTFNNTNKTYTIISSSGGGNISGATDLTQTGPGTVYLLSPTNNYTGITTLNNGVLSVTNLANSGSPSPIGAANNDPTNLVLNGGELQYTGPSGSTDHGATLGASGGTVQVTTAASTLTLAGVIAGASGGGLNVNGSGTLALSGGNTYNGNTTISAGTLQLTGNGTFGTGNVTNNSTILSSGTITIANNISGTGVVTNDATGTLTLSGNNSYSGATYINGPNDGGLVVASSSALSSSTEVNVISTTGGAIGGTRVTLNAGVSTPIGTALSLPTASTTVRSCLLAAGASSWNGPITIVGDGSMAASVDQLAFAGSGGFLTINGNVSSTSFPGGTLQLRGNGSANGGVGGAVNGTLSLSTSTLQVNDNVMWTINSTGNTWGMSQIAHGTLQIGANNALPTGTTVQFGAAGNAALDLNGFNQTVAALTVSGSTDFITNSSATSSSTLTFSSGGSSTFSSPIVDNLANGGGTLALTVAGGTLILSGTNTYNGATTISSGTLELSGSGSIANSTNILVSRGATLDASERTDDTLTVGAAQTLTGAGTVIGNVTNNGAIVPAVSGTLTINNNLTLQPGSVTSVEVDQALNSNNQIACSGTITFGGTLVVTNLAGSFVGTETYQLFNEGGSGNFTSIVGSPGAGFTYVFNPATGVLSVVPSLSWMQFISSPVISGTSLTISATNLGVGTVYLLTSSNLTAPFNTWTPIWTNVLSGSGSFTTNLPEAVNPAWMQQFYILSNTNSTQLPLE